MEQGVDTSGAAKLEAGFAKLRERFVEGLEEREEEFLNLLEVLNDPAQTEASADGIRAHAHKLHGLSGTLGYARLGSLAAQLEHHIDLILAGPRPLETGFLTELLDALLDEIQNILDDA
ncbi:Hpt domain-containing protein [Shimia sp.]|uniref:Hpt domain-containing protein n=1 Tax=Shimia sp. TaxID=1954381 RepID=UPI00356B2DE4